MSNRGNHNWSAHAVRESVDERLAHCGVDHHPSTGATITVARNKSRMETFIREREFILLRN